VVSLEWTTFSFFCLMTTLSPWMVRLGPMESNLGKAGWVKGMRVPLSRQLSPVVWWWKLIRSKWAPNGPKLKILEMEGKLLGYPFPPSVRPSPTGGEETERSLVSG